MTSVRDYINSIRLSLLHISARFPDGGEDIPPKPKLAAALEQLDSLAFDLKSKVIHDADYGSESYDHVESLRAAAARRANP